MDSEKQQKDQKKIRADDREQGKRKSLNGRMTFGGNWISVNRSCDQLVSSMDG